MPLQYEGNDPIQKKLGLHAKLIFYEAQLKLKKTRGSAIMQAGFYHANALAATINKNIQEQITSRNSEIVALLQNISALTSSSSSLDSS